MNKIVIIGRLGKDPEVRTTQAGDKVCNFSVATDDGYGANKKTNWHRVTAFGKQCGPIETYLKKGSLVGVVGRLDYRSYEKDGVTVYPPPDVIADNVEFLNGGEAKKDTKDTGHYTNTGITDEDLPF